MAQSIPRVLEIIGKLTRSAEAHNLKVVGSNPTPATKSSPVDQALKPRLPGFSCGRYAISQDGGRCRRDAAGGGGDCQPTLTLAATRSCAPNRDRNNEGKFTLGRERFAKISAVEGLKLTPEMKRRIAELDRKGLKSEERIRAIVAAHRKG